MAIQMTIIGLGQIGTSIGLGLQGKTQDMLRVGHDIELATARQAEKLGAVDRISINLPSAVEKADLVILALPVDQVQGTLKVIAPDLRKDAVILDTAPVKEHLLAWIKENLPPDCHYVGLVPVIGPRYLESTAIGVEAARADMFKGGLFGIVAPPGMPEGAIKLAIDIANMLEAEHLFLETVESDSLMASLHLLPQLVSGALLSITVERPGWQEGKKMAGRPYAQATGILNSSDGPQALANAAVNDQISMLRVLDGLVGQLGVMRQLIAEQDEATLAHLLHVAVEGRARWWHERNGGNWASNEQATMLGEMPKRENFLGRMFGIQPRQKK